MGLVSGKTYILFDGKYKLREKALPDGEKRQIIAFNEENNLEIPPSHTHVQSLPFKFPGTLVSLRFILHREYLRRVREVVDEWHENS